MIFEHTLASIATVQEQSSVLSERGRCEASLKSSVSKLKGVTKKRPECPHTFKKKIAIVVNTFTKPKYLCQCQFRAFRVFLVGPLFFTGQVRNF